MRIYELCLIFHNDTSDEQQDQIFQSISGIITAHNGSVLKRETWSKKNFKYLIKKQSKGHYCFVVFEADAPALKEIERSIVYNESVLRYNVIRLEKFVDVSAGSAEAVVEAQSGDEPETETAAVEQTTAPQE